MHTFKSFDGIQIAYHDEGEGPAVILLHGVGVDGLGQFGDFERILPILENDKRFSERCLAERLRFPILPSKEGQEWSARCSPRLGESHCGSSDGS
jgi:hypothetical protein